MKQERREKYAREQAERERASARAAVTAPRVNPGLAVAQTRPVTATAPSHPRQVVAAAGMAPSAPSALPQQGSSFPRLPIADNRASYLSGPSRGGSFLHQPQAQPMRLRPGVAAVRGRGGLAFSRGRGGFNHNNAHLHVGPPSLPSNNNINTNTSTATMNHPPVAPWMQWESLSVIITDVPDYINTFQVFEAFQSQGDIDSIELWENVRGKREGKGKVRFR